MAEPLAESLTLDHRDGDETSALMIAHLPVPPDTEVVVAEASAWEALEEIRQRVADGWTADQVNRRWVDLWMDGEHAEGWPGGSEPSISGSVAAVLWPSTDETEHTDG